MNHLSGSPSKTATVVQLPGIVEPEDLEILTVPMPQPGAGQVRIHVEATGISFAEQQMRRGKYYDQPAFPFVPGYDLVGLVDAVGDGVERAMIGQRYAAITKIGGWTTAAIVDAGDLVAVPDGVSAVEAETMVINGLTAWQMLHRTAKVARGDIILVLGANGGVGSTLAARLAARISRRGSGTLLRMGWMPSSTTSVGVGSVIRGGYWPRATPSFPTAAPRRGMTREHPGCRC